MYLEQEFAPSSLFIRAVQESSLGAAVTLLLPNPQADVGLSTASPEPLEAAETKEQRIISRKITNLMPLTRTLILEVLKNAIDGVLSSFCSV